MNRKDDGAYLWSRCYGCGHRLAFSSDSCPQCGIYFDGRRIPRKFPERCGCERCEDARVGRKG